MKIFKYLAFSALLAISVSDSNAQDFDKGSTAYFEGDYETALKELMPLAEAGVVGAQTIIGWMYDNGRGVIENDVEAVKWYRFAADQGFEFAQCDLGVMYLNGSGVIQSPVEAVKWYSLAASQGSSKCQALLGIQYSLGDGVVQDYVEAFKLYRLAATQGDRFGQSGLAIAFEGGLGVVQDNVRAHMWYNIASANGDKNAAKNREDVAAKMTREDISKAQAMAQECMSSGYKNCGW